MDPVLSFILVVAVLVGVFWFFGKGKSSTPVAKPVEKVSAPAPAPAPVAEAKHVAKAEVKKAPSKAVLNKMTKKELDQFAKTEFDVKLDARETKDNMIKALQSEVRKA